jgi:hypothetical protein
MKLVEVIELVAKEFGYNGKVQKFVDELLKHQEELNLEWSKDIPTQVAYSKGGKRIRTKLGRFAVRVIGVEIPDAFVASCIGEEFGTDEYVTLLKGYEIVEAYQEGFAAESCMTGDDSDKVELYALNPNKVRLIKFVAGPVSARALIWGTDQGVLVVDRVYPSDNRTAVECIHRWAKKKGYVYRVNQDPGTAGFSEGYAPTYTVTLRHNHVYPYMDTFMYGYRVIVKGKEMLRVSNQTCDLTEFEMQTTRGYAYQTKNNRCVLCGSMYVDNESYIWLNNEERVCSECMHRVHKCSICGNIFIMPEKGRNVEICDFCMRTRYVECCMCGDLVPRAEYIYHNGAHFCDECFGDIVMKRKWKCYELEFNASI